MIRNKKKPCRHAKANDEWGTATKREELMSPELTSIASLEGTAQNKPLPTGEVLQTVQRFVEWLDGYGEVSYDFQIYFSSDLGRAAKALYYRKPLLGTLAVSPMAFSEAFVPSGRRL